MDKITTDLLDNGSIMQRQVDRLLAQGISENLIARQQADGCDLRKPDTAGKRLGHIKNCHLVTTG